MATVQTQPDKLDYASPTQFRFGIHQLPKVEFFAVSATIPAIALSDVVIPTPFKSIPMMGDQLTFDNLSITYIVDEYLENFLSIHEWMTAIGFPKSRKQFSDFKSNISNTPSAAVSPSTDRVGASTPANALFSDAYLMVLSNKNNPIVTIDFQNCFPVSLSSLQYDQSATDVNNLIATATFSYQIYEFLDC